MPRGFRRRLRTAGVDPTVHLGPVRLPNPIIAASGTFGHGDELARLCDPAQLGAITTKSLAPYEWLGHPPPRLHGTTGGMLNAVGLQGPGIEHWVDHDLPSLRAHGARVIASLWGRTLEDFALGAKMLLRARDELIAVEVNVSCPNLEDRSRMFAHAPAPTAAVIRAVIEARLELPVLAKLSPNVADLTEIAKAAMDAGAAGLTLVNTLLGLLVDAESRQPVLGAGGGGLSGPAIKPVALRAVHDVARALPSVPIVGTGGVTRGSDAVEMLLAGASAVGVGTATFRDPRAPLVIASELMRWCARRGVSRVSDLTAAMVEG